MAQHRHLRRQTCELRGVNSDSGSVVDDDDAHSAKGRHESAQPGRIVTHRDDDGDIAVRRATGGSGVRDRSVEEGAGQLCADRVVDVDPSILDQALGGPGKSQ